jgi:hypothetical protein
MKDRLDINEQAECVIKRRILEEQVYNLKSKDDYTPIEIGIRLVLEDHVDGLDENILLALAEERAKGLLQGRHFKFE